MGFTVAVGSSGKPAGVGGKIFLTLFLLVFLGMGLLFTGFLVREVVRSAKTRFWPAIPCVVLESGVVEHTDDRDNNSPYLCSVQYRYEWQGRSYTSSQVSLQTPAFSDYGKAAALAGRFPSDREAVCHVNPRQPDQSVLQHGSLWVALVVFFPLIFVAIGAGGIYFTWRRGSSAKTAAVSSKTAASLLKGRQGVGCLVGFFAIFFLAGSGFLYGMFLRPLHGVWRSRDWVQTPCVIEASRVEVHSGDDGSTYKVAVLYAYEFNGQPHKSSRYQFFDYSSSGRSAKERVIRDYPVGKRTVCLVNPDDPTQAVLSRGVPPDIWFVLLPLVFVAVGLGGMIFALRHGRREADKVGLLRNPDRGRGSPGPLGRPAISPAVPTEEGPVVLKPSSTPLKGFIGSVFIAAFWNGIVSVFLVHVVDEWSRGRHPWFLTLFLTPFVLVGVSLLGMVVVMFLKLFNPRVRLMISSATPVLGGELQLGWVFTGAVSRLRELTISLEAREEARYRRGTSTYTDKETFFQAQLVKTHDRGEIRVGKCLAVLPADLVPSLDAPNNKIIWWLKVHGDIARWPDVADEFPLTVLPLPMNSTDDSGDA
ncbi:MAG: DUF3592 domain-containing protein [Verrucomicrobiales bacterium]|nr:DUF3592 domain-containing protein [Verrucomicrobiales bacterium]